MYLSILQKGITMYAIQSLQTDYLAYLIKNQKRVTVCFKNGCKIMGVVMGMTDEVIFFKHGITKFFYKKSINALIPAAQYIA